MRRILFFVLVFIQLLSASQNMVVVGGLKHPDVSEFSERYNQKLREVWGIDSDISLVSKNIIDQIEYKYPEEGVGPNEVTQKHLERYSVSSAVVAVLQLQEFFIETRRKPGVFGVFSGEAHGVLVIRFSYFDLATGDEIQTFVVEVSADKKLGTALRPVEKTVNMSALDRDMIIKELIDKSIEKSYRSFRRVMTTWGERVTESGSEEPEAESE